LSTDQSRVLLENAQLRVEWNVVRNLTTQLTSSALRIAPIDESRHEVVLLPVLADGRLLLLGRYRYAAARWSIELPRYWGQSSDGGWRASADESLLKTTGMRAERMSLLGALQADPALIAVNTIVILAEGCTGPHIPPTDADELIAGSVSLTEEEVYRMIRQGEIICGTTLAALTLYRAHGG